ncbi:MAG: hypothetical protein HXY30_20775, partial [Pseudorhodoplanes sp.]|nr:hypothetical protein [Pseudorhodoplanes sp.]
MSDDAGALSVQNSPPTEADYNKIFSAVMETERGRWFLTEYARRNRSADTTVILTVLDRIEATMRFQKAVAQAAGPLGALQPEIEDIKSRIVSARENLAAIKPHGSSGGKPSDFDALAYALEQLSLKIRSATERLLDGRWSSPERASVASAEDFERDTGEIAESCAAIERIAEDAKGVARLLRTIEDRIDLFLSQAEQIRSESEPAAKAAQALDRKVDGAEIAAEAANGSIAAAAQERTIEAGPDWVPPIIQTDAGTNSEERAFEPQAAPIVAPIKGPSGWLSKLSPVVSFTARLAYEADNAAAPSPQGSSAAAAPPSKAAPPAEPPAADPGSTEKPAPQVQATRASISQFPKRNAAEAAVKDKAPGPLFDTYFPASDSFRFNLPPLPPERRSDSGASKSSGETETAKAPAPSVVEGPSKPHTSLPAPDASKPDATKSAPRDSADTTMASAEADASPKAESRPEAETGPEARVDAKQDFTGSLLAALEREISVPLVEGAEDARAPSDELAASEKPKDPFDATIEAELERLLALPAETAAPSPEAASENPVAPPVLRPSPKQDTQTNAGPRAGAVPPVNIVPPEAVTMRAAPDIRLGIDERIGQIAPSVAAATSLDESAAPAFDRSSSPLRTAGGSPTRMAGAKPAAASAAPADGAAALEQPTSPALDPGGATAFGQEDTRAQDKSVAKDPVQAPASDANGIAAADAEAPAASLTRAAADRTSPAIAPVREGPSVPANGNGAGEPGA